MIPDSDPGMPVFPTFKDRAKEMIDESQLSGKGVDLFAHVHRCIAEAMLIVALGKVSTSDRVITIPVVLTTYGNYHL